MSKEISKILLDIKAVHLNPENFFTWTSGIKSPIYCDNRQIISYPELRKVIIDDFVNIIKKHYPNTGLIAGTATAGIPWASWIAQELNLPMIYIRGKSKGHGLKNAIEGKVVSGQRTVVIEDLISTGSSSIAAAKEVEISGLKLESVISIFNYGFPFADQNFLDAQVDYRCLTSLDAMLEYAKDENLLTDEQIDIIKKWKNSTNLN